MLDTHLPSLSPGSLRQTLIHNPGGKPFMIKQSIECTPLIQSRRDSKTFDCDALHHNRLDWVVPRIRLDLGDFLDQVVIIDDLTEDRMCRG